MFGKCLWLSIAFKNQIYAIHQKIMNKHSDIKFNPHVTVKTNTNNKFINNWYTNNKNSIIILNKPLIITQTRNNNFYSLQTDVVVKNAVFEKNQKPHISFAYRLNKPFTKKEIEDVQNEVNNITVTKCNPFVSCEICNFDNDYWMGEYKN